MSNPLKSPGCIDEARGSALLHYALGDLNDDERRDFEEHLLSCPACQAELAEHDADLQVLRGMRKSVIEGLAGTEKRSPAGNLQRQGRRWIALAAAAVLSAFVVAKLVWREPQPGDDVAATIPPDSTAVSATLPRDTALSNNPRHLVPLATLAIIAPLAYTSITPRGEQDSADKIFREAMEFYARGEYRTAQPLLTHAAKSDSMNSQIALYAGVNALMAHDLKVASSELARGIALKPKPTRLAQMRWYLSQVWLQEERAEDAKRLLKLVVATDDAFAQEARQQLLAIAKRDSTQ